MDICNIINQLNNNFINLLLNKSIYKDKIIDLTNGLDSLIKLLQNKFINIFKTNKSLKDNINQYYQIYNNDNNLYKNINKESENINIKDDDTIYTIGDMEGNLSIFYHWLLYYKFIDENLNWIAPTNIWIVQCGDQIDDVRSDYRNLDTDIAYLIFMDYLNIKSNGHVMSIIGNHEIMNVYNNMQYTKIQPIDDYYIKRLKLFTYNGIIGKILRRRKFIIQIKNYIFSHAGITSTNVNEFLIINNINTLDISNFITDINNEINNQENWEELTQTKIFEKVIWNPNNFGIIWNRYFYEDTNIMDGNNLNMDENNTFNNINLTNTNNYTNLVMITGHNTQLDNKIKICDAKTLNEVTTIPCLYKENGNLNNTKLILTDTESGRKNNLKILEIQNNNYKIKEYSTDYIDCDFMEVVDRFFN